MPRVQLTFDQMTLFSNTSFVFIINDLITQSEVMQTLVSANKDVEGEITFVVCNPIRKD